MLKKISLLIAVSTMALVVIYLVAVLQNNRDASYPQKVKMQQQLEKSVQWLLRNQTEILSQNNPMLWWMLYETHKISHDVRISDLLEKYSQSNRQIMKSAWAPLFDGQKHRYLDSYSVHGLPYYKQHFIYALNCAADIEDELPVVTQQNNASFCHQNAYFYRPACITHQLMGINFLLTKNCNFLPNINEVSLSLQQDIVNQLTWDIRVVDVYLQRVLMLLITGAESSVKPIWIQNVLEHQLNDGGWGGFVSFTRWSDSKSLGFSGRGISTGQEKSDFHATAQGVYILTYLLSHN